MIFGSAPAFWFQPPGRRARLLAPLSALYGAAASRRLERAPRPSTNAPVLCVGNPTLGGGGKTPTALALARTARGMGLKPGILSRGHGGSATGPTLVNHHRHGAGTVGDEPLLLAAEAPTVVSRDRKAGADLLTGEAGCDFIIMDDGFQSARLRIDFALLVVDAFRGFGNGAVFPAGPLRAPLGVQMRHADALLLVGEGPAAARVRAEASRLGLPVHGGRLAPENGEALTGAPLLAFSGIADPGKFHRSLRGLGADLRATRDFPDHHPFSERDIRALEADADAAGLTLATTAKDAARLGSAGSAGAMLLSRTFILQIELELEDARVARSIIEATTTAFARRQMP